MSVLEILIVALFLPLFPASMVFNIVYRRFNAAIPRAMLLLVWPQIGLAVLATIETGPPAWIAWWALFTAALYAFRMLALREVGVWSGFLATSAWALFWLPGLGRGGDPTGALFALGFSAPLVLLALLVEALEQRFAGAYAGLCSGLAQATPRLAGVLVAVVLAVIATPLFPGFFGLLTAAVQTLPQFPAITVGLLMVWMLWSWAGARLIQGLIVGPGSAEPIADLDLATSWAYVGVLVLLVAAGLVLMSKVA